MKRRILFAAVLIASTAIAYAQSRQLRSDNLREISRRSAATQAERDLGQVAGHLESTIERVNKLEGELRTANDKIRTLEQELRRKK